LGESRESLKIFLDSSVILSACGSTKSLSRLITEIAEDRGWNLVSAAYCRAETGKNLAKFVPQATAHWQNLQVSIEWLPNALTTKRPLLLTASKDKPVLISALVAKPDVLLTLDARDFALLLNTEVYGVLVTTPRNFLIREGLG
jgi:predicted nucleic acid-binding protein